MSGDDIAMRATLDTSGAASGFQQLNGHLSHEPGNKVRSRVFQNAAVHLAIILPTFPIFLRPSPPAPSHDPGHSSARLPAPVP
jgi:hypothetical protein